MDRAADSGSVGRGFKSLRAHFYVEKDFAIAKSLNIIQRLRNIPKTTNQQ